MERERENGFVAVKSVSQGNYLKRNVFKKRETERDRERVIIKERREREVGAGSSEQHVGVLP